MQSHRQNISNKKQIQVDSRQLELKKDNENQNKYLQRRGRRSLKKNHDVTIMQSVELESRTIFH